MNKIILSIFLIGYLSAGAVVCADAPDLELQQQKVSGRLGFMELVAEEAVACALYRVVGLVGMRADRKPIGNPELKKAVQVSTLLGSFGGYQASRAYVYSPGRKLEEKLLEENKQLREVARTVGINVDKNLLVTDKKDASWITNRWIGFGISCVAGGISGTRALEWANEIFPNDQNKIDIAALLRSVLINTLLYSLETKLLYDPEGDRRCELVTENEQLRKVLAGCKDGAARGVTLHV
jgi:hypothetical protein